MTKKHFIDAAALVHRIVSSDWTNEPPRWADHAKYQANGGYLTDSYARGVQTAEAFIILFQRDNPRFDEQRFLIACGLTEKPTKPRKVRA